MSLYGQFMQPILLSSPAAPVMQGTITGRQTRKHLWSNILKALVTQAFHGAIRMIVLHLRQLNSQPKNLLVRSDRMILICFAPVAHWNGIGWVNGSRLSSPSGMGC